MLGEPSSRCIVIIIIIISHAHKREALSTIAICWIGCVDTVVCCAVQVGANALVAGSAVFGAKDYGEAIHGIKTSKNPSHAKQPVAA